MSAEPESSSSSIPEWLQTAKSPALIILALLAVLYTLYVAQAIILPFLLAGFFALFLSPIVRACSRFRIPKLLSSAIILLLALAGIFYMLIMLVEPASDWMGRFPLVGDKIAAEIDKPDSALNAITETVIPDQQSETESVQEVVDSALKTVFRVMAEGALSFIVQFLITVVTTYFFLGFGEELLRNIVKAQETFSQKKVTVVMFETTRDDISYYVLVISVINLCLGLATAGVMSVLGVEDALLWGVLAFILNYAPYVGPAILFGILAFVGFVQFESFSEGLMVPGAFLVLNILEGQFITPSLLGRRFNINPLLVVTWMFFWSWMWGAVGLLIAIPMLMCLKIMARHLAFMGDWIYVFDGNHHHPHHPPHHENTQSTT